MNTSTCRCWIRQKWSHAATASAARPRTNTRLQSQQRTAAAQAAGKLDDEIVPLPSNMGVMDRETKEISFHDVVLEKDEGNRPTTTLEGLAA